MKMYKRVFIISILLLLCLAFLIDHSSKKAQERIEYIMDPMNISDEVMDDMILIPEVVIPEDMAFWFYRFHGKKSYATFYNDMYNLTFQDFGDSLDLQFEFFEDGMENYAEGKVKYYKDEVNFLTYLVVIFSCIAFIAGYFIKYILKKLGVEDK